MAVTKGKGKAAPKKTSKNEFKEFSFSGKNFEYSGRIYPSREGSGKVLRSWGMYLCLNGVFTLSGVRLTETKSNIFLSYPSYQSGDDYKSYVFIDDDGKEDIDRLVEYLCKLVGVNIDDEVATDGSTDLPF